MFRGVLDSVVGIPTLDNTELGARVSCLRPWSSLSPTVSNSPSSLPLLEDARPHLSACLGGHSVCTRKSANSGLLGGSGQDDTESEDIRLAFYTLQGYWGDRYCVPGVSPPLDHIHKLG